MLQMEYPHEQEVEECALNKWLTVTIQAAVRQYNIQFANKSMNTEF